MNDDRISQGLHQQAESITLTPADPAGAMRRGTRRRTRRRVGLLGSVAVVGVLATSIAVRDDGSKDEQLDLANGATASASTFDWSTVTPETGLAWGSDTVLLSDGSVYSISTAPGPYDPEDQAQYESTLYRSSDGRDWSAASLPSGVRSSDLAGTGDTLYSVGTSPSGGLVLSSSTDGASTWSSQDLPSEVADLQARHPGNIMLGQVEMAAKDATHMVVGITASTNLDLSKYRPEYSGDKYVWQWDDAGVKVYEADYGDCTAVTTVVDSEGADTSAVDADAARNMEEQAKSCRAPAGDPAGSGRGELVDDLTYDELGITGELREHVGGKPYVYATEDGQSFRPVELPHVPSPRPDWLYMVSPLSVSDGYRLVVPGNQQTTILRSADGLTWEEDSVLAASGGPAGVLNGRAALSTWDANGKSLLQLQNADGSWSALDLADAVGGDSNSYGDTVAFGPLGFAAVVSNYRENEPPTFHLVHSADGVNLQVRDLADDVPEDGTVSGVVVTADAIAVRISDAIDGDLRTPPTQRVLVGTPTS